MQHLPHQLRKNLVKQTYVNEMSSYNNYMKNEESIKKIKENLV